MADVFPKPPMRVAEYETFRVNFSAVLAEDESLNYIKIIEWDENDGVTVDGSSIYGSYIGAFELGDRSLLVRKGDEFSSLKYWEEITEANRTDVYRWEAPTHSIYFKYMIELSYTITTKGDEGGTSSSSSSRTEIVKIPVSHEVYPNWDFYSRKLKNQISIRRNTWLE